MTFEIQSLLHKVNAASVTVLIVEDNDGLRRMVVEVLRSAGFTQLVQARDAEEAIELLGAHNPDLMVLDWNLPSMSGVDLVRLMRKAAVAEDPRFPNPRMPVIMLTSRHRSGDVTEARNAGADEFVVKPFSMRSLMRAAASCLCRPRPFVIAQSYIGPCRRRRKGDDYNGLMRRADDVETAADPHYREMFQQTLSIELEGLRALMAARGGLHRDTLAYMVSRALEAEKQATTYRLSLMAEATRSLNDYVSWFQDTADPEVLDVHLDSIRRLNDLRNEDTPEAVAIIRQLNALVDNRKKRRLQA
ncbi:MAG: response regulator [Asticcacaulis sp.]